MPERRPARTKPCPIDDCDWILVTAWYIGNPNQIWPVSMDEQQHAVGLHMRKHWTPERTHLS